MPIRIRIHESDQYYVATHEGTIAIEDLIRVYGEFYANGDVPVGLPELVDASSADYSGVSLADLAALAKWAEELHRQRGETRKLTAIYDPRSSCRCASTIYEVWTEHSPESVRVFMGQAEAIRWLTGDNEA